MLLQDPVVDIWLVIDPASDELVSHGVYVGEKDVGDIEIQLHPKGISVSGIGIQPGRRGYGRAVMRLIEQFGRDTGRAEVVAEDVQLSAEPFWHAIGYRPRENDPVSWVKYL